MSDYPPGMKLRPIEHWPGRQTANRVRSPFSAPWRATLNLLERELAFLSPDPRRLVATSVLQIAMREQDFRVDGLPRANAKPEHPGVILTVASAKGTLSFPCDKFLTWQENLRAIALALEALRRVDRYGITPNDEQYTGWKQLPAAGATSLSIEDAEKVLRMVGRVADPTPVERAPLDRVYKAARVNAHPDRNDGDQSGWDAVEAAADVLRAAGRLS